MVFISNSVDKIWSPIYMQDRLILADGLYLNFDVRLSKKLYGQNGLFDENF